MDFVEDDPQQEMDILEQQFSDSPDQQLQYEDINIHD